MVQVRRPVVSFVMHLLADRHPAVVAAVEFRDQLFSSALGALALSRLAILSNFYLITKTCIPNGALPGM